MSTRYHLHRAFIIACATDIVRSALVTALVVGTILNLINQGARWLDGDDLLRGHLLLNYAVPYLVATYSSVRTRMQDIAMRMDRTNIADNVEV